MYVSMCNTLKNQVVFACALDTECRKILQYNIMIQEQRNTMIQFIKIILTSFGYIQLILLQTIQPLLC
jgi:predicted nucleic acid-binding Zn ribbon protein